GIVPRGVISVVAILCLSQTLRVGKSRRPTTSSWVGVIRRLTGYLFLALTAVYVVVARVGGNGGPLRRGRGLLVQLPDALFHLLAWLERDYGFRLDIDALTRARIAGLPRLAPLDLENAEITQFNSPLGKQRVNDRIESLLHDFLGLEL